MSDDLVKQSPEVTRRVVLRRAALGGVALPLLAACGGGDESGAATSSSPGDAGGAALADVADVPVGGGVILTDDKIVLTQANEGEILAFSSICTHQGCPLASVKDGLINCDCHGSQFSVEDGSNVTGPSGSEAGSVADLKEIKVSVTGGKITRA